ncbi:glutaredoxin family protein [Nocardiopsis salina]|uniref:glutaredoxin family protein n=1 Tax=Nocardiopsis salina TaxID=245836 RepID=UPI0003682F5E|nr:glutaredoxin family protein [Nocardiopsis salina]
MAETGDWTRAARVVVLGKPGCHLCADAWGVVERVTDELGATRAEVSLHDVTGSDREDYWDKIPVTFVDGERHDFWRVDEGRLRSALES